VVIGSPDKNLNEKLETHFDRHTHVTQSGVAPVLLNGRPTTI
jgi:hypothetical protein